MRGASLVVLPLESEDGAGHDWFANAITSDLTTDLGDLRDTTVIGRGTARLYKGRDPRDIARELEVRYVLRGSVRRHADRSRLNLSLVDGESGAIRWAQTIDVPRA